MLVSLRFGRSHVRESTVPDRSDGRARACAGGRRRDRRHHCQQCIVVTAGVRLSFCGSSRFAGVPCLALFLSAATAMPARPRLSLPPTHPDLASRIAGAAKRLGYSVV
jgi:hypothetical protein